MNDNIPKSQEKEVVELQCIDKLIQIMLGTGRSC